MAGTIYVGNLKWEATEDSLRDLFSPIGEVTSVKIISDRETGRSRGFAFVTMENADQAIQQINGKDFMGRPLKINPAEDKPPRRDNTPRPEYQPRSEYQPRHNSERSNYQGSYAQPIDRPRREFGGAKKDFRKRDRDRDNGNDY